MATTADANFERSERQVKIARAHDERHRRIIVKLVLLILLLVVFEGALRKWVFVEPFLQRATIFARDPIILLSYILALRWRRISFTSGFVIIPVIGFFVISALTILQELTSERETNWILIFYACLLYTSPSPRDRQKARMPSSA